MVKKNTKPSPPMKPLASTTSPQVEPNSLVIAAMDARRQGLKLRTVEAAALRKYERALEENSRWEYYSAISKKHWLRLAGRTARVLDSRTAKHGMPVGSTVDLAVFVRWVYDTIDSLPPVPNDDDLMASNDRSPALERYRLARAKSEELNLLERQNQLIDRGELHAVFGKMAALLRGGGEQLQRQFGPDALELYNEVIDDLAAVSKQFFNSDISQHKEIL